MGKPPRPGVTYAEHSTRQPYGYAKACLPSCSKPAAIHDAFASGKIKSLSAGKMGMGTREVGDFVAQPNGRQTVALSRVNP